MIYDLAQLIREANREAHIDLSKAIQEKKNGLLTIRLRLNGGNIVDLVELEYYAYESKRARTTPDNR
jgi:hypothetical protein